MHRVYLVLLIFFGSLTGLFQSSDHIFAQLSCRSKGNESHSGNSTGYLGSNSHYRIQHYNVLRLNRTFQRAQTDLSTALNKPFSSISKIRISEAPTLHLVRIAKKTFQCAHLGASKARQSLEGWGGGTWAHRRSPDKLSPTEPLPFTGPDGTGLTGAAMGTASWTGTGSQRRPPSTFMATRRTQGWKSSGARPPSSSHPASPRM